MVREHVVAYLILQASQTGKRVCRVTQVFCNRSNYCDEIHHVQQRSAEVKPDSCSRRRPQQPASWSVCPVFLLWCQKKLLLLFLLLRIYNPARHYWHSFIFCITFAISWDINVFIYCFKWLFIIPLFINDELSIESIQSCMTWFFFFQKIFLIMYLNFIGANYGEQNCITSVYVVSWLFVISGSINQSIN